MAVGLALMIGFVLIQNFDSPYKADSITDFWRRWHISLSTWLRDYLYIPLGGNRQGPGRTYVNLMMVMLLGGLWHGASWNFVIWGAIHGGMLAVERAQGKDSPYRRLPRPVRVAITFLVVCLSGCSSGPRRWARRWSYFRSLFGVSEPGYRGQRRGGHAVHALPRRHAGAGGRAGVRDAQHLEPHRADQPAPGGGGRGAAGAVDPPDVDPDHQPLPLLPVLSG